MEEVRDKMTRNGIEEIVGVIITTTVLVSIFSILFTELNISSFINKGLFALLILAMFIALIAKIFEILRDMF